MTETPFQNPFAKTEEETKDFSRKSSKEPVTWTMDGDTFQARSSLPGGVVLDMAKIADEKDTRTEEQVKIVTGFLQTALLPASYKKFTDRLNDLDNPIDLDQIMDVFEFLISKYTEGSARPTKDPSPSLGGLAVTGLTSPGPVPLKEGLTFAGLPSAES